MRTILALLLSAGGCLGQSLFGFGDMAFMGNANASTASATSVWSPTNIPGVQLWLDFQTMPTNGTLYNWTNSFGGTQVFTNMGTAYPTNSASGVYFPGGPNPVTNYFVNGNSGVPWTNGLNTANFASFWVSFTLADTTPYNVAQLVGNSRTAGYGFWHKNGNTMSLQNGVTLVGVPVTQGVRYNYAFIGTNSDTIAVILYTNGVLWGTSGNVSAASGYVWGIGRDADNDQQFKGYIRHVLFCTNYSFTASDISNLNTYAQSH
jgi:hypothetical protein